MFQCSSASRKFLNQSWYREASGGPDVSVLFSEPKIPQSYQNTCAATVLHTVSVLFSEPKIPQSTARRFGREHMMCFSALQRAENSSIRFGVDGFVGNNPFQCSSASRKFLNKISSTIGVLLIFCFSALQRAENSSIPILRNRVRFACGVSVLFSEPKIPQFGTSVEIRSFCLSFSALQRAENSSI